MSPELLCCQWQKGWSCHCCTQDRACYTQMKWKAVLKLQLWFLLQTKLAQHQTPNYKSSCMGYKGKFFSHLFVAELFSHASTFPLLEVEKKFSCLNVTLWWLLTLEYKRQVLSYSCALQWQYKSPYYMSLRILWNRFRLWNCSGRPSRLEMENKTGK